MNLLTYLLTYWIRWMTGVIIAGRTWSRGERGQCTHYVKGSQLIGAVADHTERVAV